MSFAHERVRGISSRGTNGEERGSLIFHDPDKKQKNIDKTFKRQ